MFCSPEGTAQVWGKAGFVELQRGFRESAQLNGVILIVFKVPWQVLGDTLGWKRVLLSCYGAITPESVTKEYLHVKIMRGVCLKSVKRCTEPTRRTRHCQFCSVSYVVCVYAHVCIYDHV